MYFAALATRNKKEYENIIILLMSIIVLYTHFLQLNFGLYPNLEQADFMALPSATMACLPLYVNFTFPNREVLRRVIGTVVKDRVDVIKINMSMTV